VDDPLKCGLCRIALGERYATLIGSDPDDVFNICWACWERIDVRGTVYHPSIHDDGPPLAPKGNPT